MKLTVLNETGDTVMTDEVTTGIERVTKMTTAEIEKEFDKLVKDGHIAIDDKTNKIHVGRIEKTDSITMLYPVIGG